jgi:hypothetical protein
VVAALVEGLVRNADLRRRVLAGQERLAARVRSTDHRSRVLEALAPALPPRP